MQTMPAGRVPMNSSEGKQLPAPRDEAGRYPTIEGGLLLHLFFFWPLGCGQGKNSATTESEVPSFVSLRIINMLLSSLL